MPISCNKISAGEAPESFNGIALVGHLWYGFEGTVFGLFRRETKSYVSLNTNSDGVSF